VRIIRFPTALLWAIMNMHLWCVLSAERIFILDHANGMVNVINET